MAEVKTKKNTASAVDFINSIGDEKKIRDGKMLLTLFKKITGKKPVMWGKHIIGFGEYHYKSERSAQEGDWPLTGFTVRKTNLTIYVMQGFSDTDELLKKLGKHKKSMGCIYINKLEDIDIKILEKIVKKSFVMMKKMNKVK